MNVEEFPRYHYRATVIRVTDGDTIVVSADCGLRVYHTISVRLAGANAPELFSGTPEERALGAVARDALAALIGGRTVYLRTHKDGQSFARYVADCYVDVDGTGELSNVADLMIAGGYATR